MSKQIRVARGGKNALTSTDPNDFIFHSEYNTFKIVEEGSEEFVMAPTGDEEESISIETTHSNQFAFVFIKFANGRVAPPGTKASDVEFWFTRVEIDGTNILCSYVNLTGGNYTATFKYYICELPL